MAPVLPSFVITSFRTYICCQWDCVSALWRFIAFTVPHSSFYWHTHCQLGCAFLQCGDPLLTVPNGTRCFITILSQRTLNTYYDRGDPSCTVPHSSSYWAYTSLSMDLCFLRSTFRVTPVTSSHRRRICILAMGYAFRVTDIPRSLTPVTSLPPQRTFLDWYALSMGCVICTVEIPSIIVTRSSSYWVYA